MIRDTRGGYNRKKVNENFFKTWSPKMAYVLGFMFADGSLVDSNSSSRTYYLSFSNNDFELLVQIREALGSDHKIYTRAPQIMKHRSRKYISRRSYVFRFGNKAMYKDLLSLGMSHRKSRKMCLPPIPRNFFSFFMRGYFDGDGCINLYTGNGRKVPQIKVIFTSGSEVFLDETASRIAEILPISVPKRYPSMGAYNLLSTGISAIKILDYMYADIKDAPHLQRKYEKYIDYRNNLMGPRMRKAVCRD